MIILAAIIIPLTISSPKFDNDITMNGLQSLDTNDKIEDEFGQDSEKAQIRAVFKSDSDNGIVKQDMTKDIKDTLKDIKDDDGDIKISQTLMTINKSVRINLQPSLILIMMCLQRH